MGNWHFGIEELLIVFSLGPVYKDNFCNKNCNKNCNFMGEICVCRMAPSNLNAYYICNMRWYNISLFQK